jgi:PUL domain
VDLPNIVFNTPGGQMLRPMIENMQNAVYSQPSGGVNTTYYQPSSGVNAANSQQANSDRRLLQNSASNQANAPANIEDKQLVSSDNQTVNALGNKILNLKSTLKNADGTAHESSALSAEKKAVITKIMQVIMNAKDTTAESTNGNSFAEDACNTLSSVISEYPQLQMSSLFLMRLLILQEKLLFSGPNSAVATMIDSLLNRLSAAQGTTDGFSSVPSTVMGLCTVANLLSHPSGQIFIFDRPEIAGAVVDIAVSALSNTRVEVRQMGATVAYNFTFSFNDAMHVHPIGGASRLILSGDGELNPLAVQLFCGAMEEISSEREDAVRYRRLCVALKIVRMGGSGAQSLGRDLGFGNDIAAISPSSVLETQVLGELRRAFTI